MWSCGGSKRTVKTGTSHSGPRSLVQFQKSNSLMSVLEDAQTEDKIVFVDVYTTWCLPCRVMDEEVFTERSTARFLNSNFINYKIDAERSNGPTVAAIYEVQAYPTLLFLDSNGRVLVRKEGAVYHDELQALGNRALQKWRSGS